MRLYLLILAVYVLLLGFSAVIAAAETSVLMLPPGRIHRLVEAERPGAVALDRLADYRHRLRSVSSLTGGLTYGAAALTGLAFGVELRLGAAGGAALAVAAVLITQSVGQALPRTLAVTNPERVGLDTARGVLPLVGLVYPLSRVLGSPWRWLSSLIASERTVSPWAVTAEWRSSEPDDEDSSRETAEEALLEAVSDFAEKVVREVMVPRTDVKALADSATVDEAVAMIVKTGFTRVPVFHDSIDDVRGVLYAKDLLGVLGNGSTMVRLLDIARAPYFVPEMKPVEELLVEMRSKTHIAIVADEYGGTAGIVTLEDLLEEIVGEISDEYDREEPLLVELGEDRYQVDARLPVDDLNEIFGTDIEMEADSVGGLFSEVSGHIPDMGESLEIEGLRLTVTNLQGTRICQLIVEPAGSVSEGETDA
jgi:putative hemolysin